MTGKACQRGWRSVLPGGAVRKLGTQRSVLAQTRAPRSSDAAYEAILLATNYIRDRLPVDEERGLTEIRSTDANVARDCLKSGNRDHHEQIENLAQSFSTI